jgi:hypothetical protein
MSQVIDEGDRAGEDPHLSLRPRPTAEADLARLALQARRDLAALAHPAAAWVRPISHASGQHVFDVVIVGTGQSGLAIGLALKRQGVNNVLLLDRSPVGYEGPWETFARMAVLRTPKALVGAELGIPSLSVRAWFEARYGAEAWELITWIPRHDWMRYLLVSRHRRSRYPKRHLGRRHQARGPCAGAEDGRPGGRRFSAGPPDCTGHRPRWRRGVDRARHRRPSLAAGRLRSFERAHRLRAVRRQAHRDPRPWRLGVRCGADGIARRRCSHRYLLPAAASARGQPAPLARIFSHLRALLGAPRPYSLEYRTAFRSPRPAAAPHLRARAPAAWASRSR